MTVVEYLIGKFEVLLEVVGKQILPIPAISGQNMAA
jgi:hypothetical protein